MPLIEECVKRNLSTILASFNEQTDERRKLVNRVEEGRGHERRKLRTGGGSAGSGPGGPGGPRGLGGSGGPGSGSAGRMRSRPGTGDLAKQLSTTLDDWGMGEEVAGEGTSDLFKRIDDKMTLLDDYTRGNTFQIGSEHGRLGRELDRYIFSLQLRPSRRFVHQTALTGEKKTQNPKILL